MYTFRAEREKNYLVKSLITCVHLLASTVLDLLVRDVQRRLRCYDDAEIMCGECGRKLLPW